MHFLLFCFLVLFYICIVYIKGSEGGARVGSEGSPKGGPRVGPQVGPKEDIGTGTTSIKPLLFLYAIFEIRDLSLCTYS